MLERWFSTLIWSGERRRHGAVIREVLAAWQPGPTESEAVGPIPCPWSRDEDLLRGLLALLWQGASATDLARWLERTLGRRFDLDATREEFRQLAEQLVLRYEESLRREGRQSSS